MSATANVLVGLAISLLALASYLRWWRVAQREHYEPGRLVAMAAIWCRAQPTNVLALAAVLALCLVGLKLPLVGLVGALVWLLWPPGLALLRPAKKLAWTPRVRRLAAITVVLHVVVTGFFLAFGEAVALVPLLALPIAEVALLAAHPLEDQLSRRYEVSAAARIKQVAPRVVAITGSYGKTSTKNYAAHLMAGRWSVLASPASFNNVLGLARAVNDRLTPGTDVFVAEMGTYGPGEIARLCRLFPPEVSAITTIGEAHLERMRDRATIVRAKSEILEPAQTIVLNVDVPELAAAAEQYAATKRVIRCATTEGATADVVVRRDGDGWLLVLSGHEHRVTLPTEVGHPINVAVAVGLALAVDVPEKAILDRLALGAGDPAPRRDHAPRHRRHGDRRHLQRQPRGRRAGAGECQVTRRRGRHGVDDHPRYGRARTRAGAAQRRLRPGRHGRRAHAAGHRRPHQPDRAAGRGREPDPGVRQPRRGGPPRHGDRDCR